MSNKPAGVLFAAVLLAGCETSVVHSVPLAADTWVDKGYLTYGVGQSIIVVEIGAGKPKAETAGIGDDEPAADDAADDEDTPEGATAPAGKADPKDKAAAPKANVPAPKAAPAKKAASEPEPEADACTQLRTAYDNIVDKHALFSLALKQFRETTTPLSLKADFNAAEKKEAQAAVAKIDAAFNADFAAKRSAVDIFTVAQQVCPPPVVTITHVAAAAPGRQYVLKYNPDFYAADKVDFKVGPDGLLTSASITAKDTTGDALLSGATSLGTFVAPFPADLFGAGAMQNTVEATKAIRCDQIGGRFEQVARDLTKLPNCVSPDWLLKMLDRAPAVEPLPSLTPKPAKSRYVLSELAGKKAVFESFEVAASCSDAPPDFSAAAGMPAVPPAVDARQTAAAAQIADGLVVSSARACRIQVRDGPDVIADEQFWALDPTRLLVLPLSRTRLTTRTVTYAFAGGQPSKVTEDLGSPAATLFGLPGQIVGSALTGFKNTSTSQKDVIDAQTENLKAQASLISAQRDLEKAKKGEAETDNADGE